MLLLTQLPVWVGWLFGLVALVAALTDLAKHKIYNVLTMPALLLGFALVLFFAPGSMKYSLQGFLIATLCFLPLFFLKIMGAGDAKLAMALSTVLGTMGTLDLIFASFAVGGLAAFAFLIYRKRVRIFFREVFLFFQSLTSKEFATHWPKLDGEHKTPFGVAIFLGYIFVFFRSRA